MPALRHTVAILSLCGALSGCELFLDIGPDDAGPSRAPDSGPVPPLPPDSSTARFCETDSAYLDLDVNGSRYRVLGGFEFQQAQARCRIDGAELVAINTANEFDAVASLISTLPVHVNCDVAPCAWVGFTQPPQAITPDELWRWSDGTSDQQNWVTDQPDDGDGTEDGEESCAMLDTAGADPGLRDEACAIETFSICECEL